MAIHSNKNLYPGVNPHLNSALQPPPGGWNSFHSDHLTHLREALDQLLPFPYFARTETSLQIGTYDPEFDLPLGKPGRTIADVTIFGSGSGSTGASQSAAASPTLTLPLSQTLLTLEDVNAIVIYRTEAGSLPGNPVTRLELLSPANKPPGSYYPVYELKRNETILSGLCLLEIDFLHERRPLDSGVPSYPDRHEGAYPYHLIVHDPHPSIRQGRVDVYGFGVLDRLPIINIPLQGSDSLPFDFGAVYHHTYATSRLFQLMIDYSQEPVNVAAYTDADQFLIRQHMAKIAAEQSPG